MGSVCYLSMGMVVLLMGLVFASVYIYRYFFLAQVRPGRGRPGRRGRGASREAEGCVERTAWAAESQGLGVCEEGAAGSLGHAPGGRSA